MLDKPGALGGLVGAPAPKFVPSGYKLADDFAALHNDSAKLAKRKLKVKGSKLLSMISCPPTFAACIDGSVIVTSAKAKKGFKVAKGKFSKIGGGKTKKVKLKLTKKARKYFADKRKLAVSVSVSTAQTQSATSSTGKAIGKG